MPTTTRGPLPSGTYWRRRLAVLSIALVLVLGIGKLLGMGSDGSSDDTATQAGAMTSPTATVTADPSATPTKKKGNGKGKGKGKGNGGKSNQSPTPTPTPTPTTPPPLPMPTGPCADGDVYITPTVESPIGGSDVTFLLNLQTRTSEACTWQVSPDTVSMTISKNKDVVWQSQQCPASIPAQEVVVRSASVVQVPVVWNARRSDADCTDRTAWVLPDVYHVVTSALGGETTDVAFELFAPVAGVVTETVQPETSGAPASETPAG